MFKKEMLDSFHQDKHRGKITQKIHLAYWVRVEGFSHTWQVQSGVGWELKLDQGLWLRVICGEGWVLNKAART